MDPKFIVIGATVILALIFIKKIWHSLVLLLLGAGVYWYFFVR